MTIDPIPDLLSELRAGRYGHDFVSALGSGGHNDARMQVLRGILETDEAGAIVTNLLVIGARHILKVLAEADSHQRTTKAINRLKEPTADELESYAVSPESLAW